MPATDGAGRAVLRAALAALLVIGAAETAARTARPRLPSAAEDGLPRNPHYARGWPEYTRAPAPSAPPRAEPLVIAISNSQGFLREREDAGEAWPARLAQELAATGAPARVMNWSMPGGNGQEMTVLAARARQHSPDLILLVSYVDNFTDRWRGGDLGYGFTDVAHLAYLREVRARLSTGFLLAAGAYDPLGWLGAHSALVWFRNRWDDDGERWRWKAAEPTRRSRLLAADSVTLADPGSFALLDDFFDAAGAGDPGGPALLVVAMPLCGSIWRNRESGGAFATAAAARLAGNPRAAAADATALVPDREFYGARHLRPAGHARFAAWLAPRVTGLLPPRE